MNEGGASPPTVPAPVPAPLESPLYLPLLESPLSQLNSHLSLLESPRPRPPPPAGAKPDVPEKKKQKQSTLALCMRPDGLPDVVPATASIQKSPELQQLQLDLIVRFV